MPVLGLSLETSPSLPVLPLSPRRNFGPGGLSTRRSFGAGGGAGAGQRTSPVGAASYFRGSSPLPSPSAASRPTRVSGPAASPFVGTSSAYVRDTSPAPRLPGDARSPWALGGGFSGLSSSPSASGLSGLSSVSGLATTPWVPQWADASELHAHAPPSAPPTPTSLSGFLRPGGASGASPTEGASGAEQSLEQRLRKVIAEESQLRERASRSFRTTAAGRGLDLQATVAFVGLLSQMLALPQAAFGLLQVQHARFDLNGNGTLEEEEAFGLVRFTLQEYLKRLSPQQSGVDSPQKSLASAGYQIIKEIGRGNCGVLQLAIGVDGNPWCVKCVSKSFDNGSDREGSIANELVAMRTLDSVGARHPHVARVFEIFQDASCHYLVTEPYYGGDFTQIKRNSTAHGVPMTEEWWRFVMLQCVQGLAFIHSWALLHCDIKEANLMCKTEEYSQPVVVIIDFGLCQPIAQERVMICGTPGYIPPEVWEKGYWYPAGDLFSLGVSMAQLAVDKVPFVEQSISGTSMTDRSDCRVKGAMFTENTRTLKDVELATRSRPAPLHLIPAHLPGFTRLLQALLCKNPAGRPTASQALADAWLSGGTPGQAVGSGPLSPPSCSRRTLDVEIACRPDWGRPTSMMSRPASLDLLAALAPHGADGCEDGLRATGGPCIKMKDLSAASTPLGADDRSTRALGGLSGLSSSPSTLAASPVAATRRAPSPPHSPKVVPPPSPKRGSPTQLVPAWAQPEASALHPDSPMSRRRAVAPTVTFEAREPASPAASAESTWRFGATGNPRRSLLEQACAALAVDRARDAPAGDGEPRADELGSKPYVFSPQLFTAAAAGSFSASASRSSQHAGLSGGRSPSPPRPYLGQLARTIFASSGPRLMTGNYVSGGSSGAQELQSPPQSPPLSPRCTSRRAVWPRHAMSTSKLTGI